MIGVFVQVNQQSQMGQKAPTGYVLQESGCWEWVNSRDTRGYGRAWDGTRMVPAHRLLYEQEIGPIPTGMTLDHRCRNRGCVNPGHMRPLPLRENILLGDGGAARNRAKTHCPQGHPLAGDNLDQGQLKRGYRACRTCTRTQSLASYHRRRATAKRASQ